MRVLPARQELRVNGKRDRANVAAQERKRPAVDLLQVAARDELLARGSGAREPAADEVALVRQLFQCLGQPFRWEGVARPDRLQGDRAPAL